MEGHYESFPQRPPDDAVPAISQLYSSVHRRLASIVFNAAALTNDGKIEGSNRSDVNSMQSQDSLKSPASLSLPRGQRSSSAATGQSQDGPSANVHKKITVESSCESSLSRAEHEREGSSHVALLPNMSKKAPASVQSESLTAVGDLDYLDTPASSPTKRSQSDVEAHTNDNIVPGFALRREISSDSEPPTSPAQNRRPSYTREESISTVLSRLKSGTLSKEFWMKDQNAHACFRCEAAFNTFRRKHHCRLCGQIFCSNCTILTSGRRLRQSDRFRACKTCHRIMDEYGMSSESEPELVSDHEIDLPNTPVRSKFGASANAFSMPNDLKPVSTPLMAIPATRTSQNGDTLVHERALPEILHNRDESDSTQPTDFPKSTLNRLMIPAVLPRSSSSSMLNWGQGLIGDIAGTASAPFRRHTLQSPLHEASISEIGTTDLSPAIDQGRSNPTPLFNRIPSEDEEEDYWAGTVREHNGLPKKTRHVRALSQRGSPFYEDEASRRSKRRGITKHSRAKSKSLMRQINVQSADCPNTTVSLDSVGRGRTRSRSNSIIRADPEALDPTGRAHICALLQQLLRDADIKSPATWEQCLLPILTSVARHIKPKVKEGASSYINNYVKIKRIPGGKPEHCEFMSGAVFTHKLANKRMSRTIRNPRILLIAFPLEYHRADSSQLLSLEPVMAQEKEFLKNLVNRMMALRPNLVLVQNSVSGLALDYLLENNVAVAYQIKESVMAVVSGLTGADIITSIDRLAFQPRVGKCELFEVKTFVNYDTAQPSKKTYFYIKGCPPDLGCSIILRGASFSVLEKIKRSVELLVFVVYNLKLEANLFKDQNAEHAPMDPQFQDASHAEPTRDYGNEALLHTSLPDALHIFQNRILSASPGVRFPPPYLLKKAVDLEEKLGKHKSYQAYLESDRILEDPPEPIFFLTERQEQDISDLTADQQDNIMKLMEAAEQRRLNQDLQHCKSQWKTMLERAIKDRHALAYPQDRQSISVLFSAVCTETGTPCTMPTTEVIEFYKDFANDCSLGQYIEDCVYLAVKPCPVILCGRKNMDHHRSYVHAQARVSVITETYICPLPGMQNSILMWNYCKKCDATTPLIPMSEDTWAYSFGKYLELTFYDKHLQARVDNCQHNLCREYVRYFGFRDMAIRFDYDPVEIMGLALPQPFVDWQPDTFVRLKNDEFKSLQFKITAFYDSLEFRLYSMNTETLVIEQVEAYKADIQQMRQKAKDERLYLLKLLQEIFDNSLPLDFLSLNRALRATQDKVTSWNETFDEMERLYLPSEKDIRRLTTAHLRKLFSLDDTSRASIVDDEASDIEGKRSVSVPILPNETEKKMDEIGNEKSVPLNDTATELDDATLGERVVSMPVLPSGDEDEPRGFHPRRTYEQLVKHKTDQGSHSESEQASTSRVGEVKPVQSIVDVTTSGIPRPSIGTRNKSSESVNLNLESRTAPNTLQHSSRKPSIDYKNHTPSSIPIFKNVQEPIHLRKKSLTNNHLLSKQIQDLGESIVGSAEKRWNEQKRYSSMSKDSSQKNKAGETKVTSLAKHFEQLTKEFEKERLRARKMLHARGRPTFAVANQKPTVAVFDNVNDAVDDLSDEEEPNLQPLLDSGGDMYHFSNPATSETTPNRTPLQMGLAINNIATKDIPEIPLDENVPSSDVGDRSDVAGTSEKKTENDFSGPGLVPASERTTLMKTLSNFWADRSSSNWTPLEYPLPPSEHMFLESDVVVREDEPSSLIAFTLSAEEYITEIAALRQAARRKPSDVSKPVPDNLTVDERRIMETLRNPTGTHMKFAWGGDKSNARLTSRIFFAEQFDALRRFCGCDENYIASLSRCVKWDSSGGKSGSAFLKTQDDRLIVKQMSKIETEQFLRFAPNYFEYMSDNFFNKLPVSLCKILGYYQITSKNPVTGRFMKMDVIVMENLFYKRKTSRIFDLKGSMRNRKVQQTGKENEVLLDENFVELVSENPLFVRDHARRFLKSALHNDTLFLAQNNVMDYSLIIGIDDEKHELIVGIIDFIRTYTWDKKLESWVKERGLVGGGSAKPTVVTPKMYKTRFREAMDRYIFSIK